MDLMDNAFNSSSFLVALATALSCADLDFSRKRTTCEGEAVSQIVSCASGAREEIKEEDSGVPTDVKEELVDIEEELARVMDLMDDSTETAGEDISSEDLMRWCPSDEQMFEDAIDLHIMEIDSHTFCSSCGCF